MRAIAAFEEYFWRIRFLYTSCEAEALLEYYVPKIVRGETNTRFDGMQEKWRETLILLLARSHSCSESERSWEGGLQATGRKPCTLHKTLTEEGRRLLG